MATAAELYAQALQHYQAGQPAETQRLAGEALLIEPLHAETIYLLGVIALDAARVAEAIRLMPACRAA